MTPTGTIKSYRFVRYHRVIYNVFVEIAKLIFARLITYLYIRLNDIPLVYIFSHISESLFYSISNKYIYCLTCLS